MPLLKAQRLHQQQQMPRSEITEPIDEWVVVNATDKLGVDSVSSREPPSPETSKLGTSYHDYPSSLATLKVGLSWSPSLSEPLQDYKTVVDAGEPTSSDSASIPKRKNRYTGPELYPCTPCGSYHYHQDCIYLLPWTDWLEYHHNFMPSQPYPFSHNEAHNVWTPLSNNEIIAVRRKAERLDLTGEVHRPNYLANSRLKADLMTKSGREMWYEDEDFQARQKITKRNQGRAARAELSFQSPLEGTTGIVEGDDTGDELSRDERIQIVRTEFAKRLPRTSTATLSGALQRES